MKNYLIAVDLEGVHGVVGEANKGLTEDTDEYKKAVVSATSEVNTVAKSLFDNGAGKVYIWDNHNGGDNLFTELIDSRVESVYPIKEMKTRLNFLADINVNGIIYIGYHAREGSINGVLAHTYNSSAIQYIKVNGKPVGEIDVDSTIASFFGVPAIFVASDDVCVAQAKEYDERIETVITKFGTGRNSANFRRTEIVLSEIYDGVKKAMTFDFKPVRYEFPMEIEVRYTRMESAYRKLEEQTPKFADRISFAGDAHTIKATVNDLDEYRLIV
ncbi:MAG: M55 family metallopeptidase [Clostridia bacterium]|nr:M55 family metallopeptidase [Clostridia bacterium]